MNATARQYTIHDLSDWSLIECEPCGLHDTAESISDAYADTLSDSESWRVEVSDSTGTVIDSHDGEYMPD